MLKKAGIVVAAAAAGLLAVSPLAFAGDKGGYDHGHEGPMASQSEQINNIDEERDQFGLVNVNDNNVNVPVQACGNGALNTTAATSTLNTILGVLGTAGLANEAGDASSLAACEQESGAGDVTGQSNAG